MSKTSLEVDRDIAEQAAEILGTSSLRETVDEALREVVRRRIRDDLLTMLADAGRLDLDASESAWGGPE